MKKKKKISNPLVLIPVLVFVFFFGSSVVSAEEFQGSLMFDIGFPKGDFKENLDRNGYGIGINAGVRIGNTPFVIGGEFGYLNYGRDTRYESPYNIPDLTMRVINRYNIMQCHAFLRLQPLRGAIRPYVDFLVGFNYLWTETTLEEEDEWDEEVASSTNFSDTAFSYGVGGGIMIRLGDSRPGTKYFLNLSARYLLGGNAEYLQKGSIIVSDQSVEYLVSESETNLFNVQVGVAMTF